MLRVDHGTRPTSRRALARLRHRSWRHDREDRAGGILQHPEATDTRDVLRAKRDRRAELPGARDRRGGLAIDFCALAIRMVREEPRSTLCSRTASFAGVRERCAERDEPIPIGTDPPRWPGGEAQRVSAVLTVVVQHGEIVLFLYVLADQLGVPIPAAPVLMAAGGLAHI
jgi:hypothetical protein